MSTIYHKHHVALAPTVEVPELVRIRTRGLLISRSHLSFQVVTTASLLHFFVSLLKCVACCLVVYIANSEGDVSIAEYRKNFSCVR